MERISRFTLVTLAAFAAVFVVLLYVRLQIPAAETFSSDASEYSGAAVHLANEFFYSIDGVTPFIKREPGQSMWLAVIYRVFGAENRAAIFTMQALLYAIVVFLLTREASRITGQRAARIFMIIALFYPSVLHIIFSANRELLALALTMLGTLFVLRLKRTNKWTDAALAGGFFGLLLVTYSPFLLLPLWLIPALWLMHIHWKKILVFVFIAYIPILLWGARNTVQTGSACLTGCGRAAVAWHVRGEQAEHIRGIEPFMCLWAEYISRDWSQRSPYCSFNAVKNRQWPNGPVGDAADAALGKAGQVKILRYFPWYLWFSVFEVLELHVPFVNGWGRGYNIAVSLATVILYVGCLLSIPMLKRREYLILAGLVLYCIAIFILTDATPRYLMPVIFCYVLSAAIGYNWLLSKVFPTWRTTAS